MTAMVSAALIAALIVGSFIDGPHVWSAAYAVMLIFSTRDWWRWRSSGDVTPREVADRLMAHLLLFAVGAAMPALDAIEARLGR